jgi:hypothetical protein
MNSSDRGEFETQLDTLLAGFNVPRTTERVDAYWRGLSKLSLLSFARMVDVCLEGQGPTDKNGRPILPTPPQIWQLHHLRQHQAREQQRTPIESHKRSGPERDMFELYGNRVLFNFLIRRTVGCAHDACMRMVEAKDKLVADYRALGEDMPETSLELRDKLLERFNELFEPRTEAEKAADALRVNFKT